MARTMGEVLPSSFATLYSLAPRPPAANRGADGDGSPAPATLFVDVGSGYGTLCVAAVQEHGFGAAVGIEKYREPLVRCDALLASLDPATRARVTIHHADVADCDLTALFSAAVPRGSPVLLFCNNLAFPPGFAVRNGRQYAAWAAEWGGPVTIVTSTPIDGGVGRPPTRTLPLAMTFNDAHEVCVYEFWGGEGKEGEGRRSVVAEA